MPLNLMPLDLLIVDDSVAIRKILQRALHQAKLPLGAVYEAGDGAEALAILKEKTVDVIFSDINMPNMDGHYCPAISRTESVDR